MSVPSTQNIEETRAVAGRPLWRRAVTTGSAWVLGLDVGLIVLFTVLSPNQVFWSVKNFQNLLLNGSEGLLLALAMSLMLAAGLIDLSLGANLVFSSVVGVYVMVTAAGGQLTGLGAAGVQHYSTVAFGIAMGFVACIVSGLLFGMVNGLVIAYLRVNSLIATLGTTSVGTGVVLLITRGSDIGGLPSELQTNFGFAKAFGLIPLPALLALLVAVVVWAVIRFQRFGLYTLAIGSSKVSAERAGIRVPVHIVKLSVVAGGLAGLAGFVSISHFGATSINGHLNDPLNAITAAVIGGAALAGGRVSIVGTVWGTALAMILIGGLVIIGVSSFYQLLVIGAILIIAVSVDQFRNSRRDSR